MRSFTTTLFALSALSTSLAAKVDLKALKGINTANVIADAYIVELADPVTIDGKRSLRDPHADFYEQLSRRGVSNWSVRKEFKSDVFNGVSLDIKVRFPRDPLRSTAC